MQSSDSDHDATVIGVVVMMLMHIVLGVIPYKIADTPASLLSSVTREDGKLELAIVHTACVNNTISFSRLVS